MDVILGKAKPLRFGEFSPFSSDISRDDTHGLYYPSLARLMYICIV